MDRASEAEFDRRVEQFEARVEEERKRVREVDDKLAAQITNILIAGSIGAIIASVTFLKDIAPTPAAGSLGVLRSAWLALFAACVLGIASLVANRVAARHFRDLLYARLQRGDCTGLERSCSRWNGATKWLQGVSMACLALGTGLLLWFANVNLPTERTPDEREKQRSGPHAGAPARPVSPRDSLSPGTDGAGVRLRSGGPLPPAAHQDTASGWQP